MEKKIKVEADVIINATSIGMFSKINFVPISEKSISQSQLVIDMVVKPSNTKLIQITKSNRISSINGREMALNQAYEQFKLYTGKNPPKHIMQKASKKIL